MRSPLVIAAYTTLTLALGGQWIAAKLGTAAVPPLELSTVRFVIAAAILLAACAVTRTPLPIHRWRLVGAAALCGAVGFNSLAFLGISLTPATDSALIVSTLIPLATALFATLIGEPLTARKLVGFAIASVGASLVVIGGQGGGGEASALRLRGDLLEVGAAAAWGANLTIAAIVLRKESALGYTALMVTMGAVLLAPLGALEGGYRDLGSWSMNAWLAAGFLGVASTAVAFVLFFWAVRRFGASLAAMVAYLTPVTTLVLAFFILSEQPLPLQLVGGAVIVIGVRIGARRARPAIPTPVSA